MPPITTERARPSPPATTPRDPGWPPCSASAYQALSAPQPEPRTLARLVNSVLRPLAEALPAPDPAAPAQAPRIPSPPVPARPSPQEPLQPQETPPSLWDLAVTATTLRARLGAGAPPGLLEAAAALQDLAVRQARAAGRAGAAVIAELGRLQRELPPAIMTAKNGPYLVTNVTVAAHPARRGAARCRPSSRCAGAAPRRLKPFCDGTHATSGFTDGKDPNRVPDQRDTYPGQQVTIFDNRGICQHSGLCTDRVPTAFRTDAEPFVAPSGGRLDELVRAVRDCPSGALSLAFDGRARRATWSTGTARRERAIEVTQDGPYRVTGGIPLTDAARRGRAPGRGLVPRALRALPLRPLAEQAVLQRHALVRGVPRPGPRPRTRPCSSGPAGCPR